MSDHNSLTSSTHHWTCIVPTQQNGPYKCGRIIFYQESRGSQSPSPLPAGVDSPPNATPSSTCSAHVAKIPSFRTRSPQRHVLLRRNTHGTTWNRSTGTHEHETTLTQNMGLPCSQGLVPHLRGTTLPMHLCCYGRHMGRAHHRHLPFLPPRNTNTHHHCHRQDHPIRSRTQDDIYGA